MVGVLVDEATVPGVQTVLRYALQAHNNNISTVSAPPAPSYHFKLDKYEKHVDSTDSYRLTQASLLLTHLLILITNRIA